MIDPADRTTAPSPPAHDSTAGDRFGALFHEARHYRGDCRLVITAIRRGWLKPEDRAALRARIGAAPEPEPDNPETDTARFSLARILALLAVESADVATLEAAIKELFPPRRGRPHKRRS